MGRPDRDRGTERDYSGYDKGGKGRDQKDKGKPGRARTKGGSKPGESPSSALAGAADFASACGAGLFSAASLAAFVSHGFDLSETVRISKLPIGGRLRAGKAAWELVTKNPWALGVVTGGYKIRWVDGYPDTPHRGKNPSTDEAGKVILDGEVEAMLAKEAIHAVHSSVDEVVSSYFARPKKTPGKWRPIVSLKYTNSYIAYQKFRMCTPAEVKRWVLPGHLMTSVDLTDAYFAIPLEEDAWRFTRFQWRGKTYEYKVIMFGLAPSARVFTKMLHPALLFLKDAFGIMLVAYLDDILIQAGDFDTCVRHAEITVLVLQALGYGVNFNKSSLTPSQSIEHLGLVWDSAGMTVSIPQDKVDKIQERARALLATGECSGADLRSLLGTLESTRLVTTEAALHYRGLQAQLPKLQLAKGKKDDTQISLNAAARGDLGWWTRSFPVLRHTSTSLSVRPISVEVWTDASGLVGWGGHDSRGQCVQGSWTEEQAQWHINLKELEAARLTLHTLMREGDHVSLAMDSTAAVAFVRRQGGTHSRLLCHSALRLWRLVLSRGGWITATWISRDLNEQADLLSKYSLGYWDFGLREEVAAPLWDRWFRPSADLFGSSTFHLAAEYFSCFQDPQAARRDAFTVARWPQDSYAFPPPPLLSKVLEQIRLQGVRVILVAPRWPAAPWWQVLLATTLEGPVTLGRADMVCLPRQGGRLPRLGLLVACLVGRDH